MEERRVGADRRASKKKRVVVDRRQEQIAIDLDRRSALERRMLDVRRDMEDRRMDDI